MDNERVMDSHSLEKERGITILSKQTSFLYNNIRINIIDTPGHQDFGGEVERIMNMIDGLLLLIDINEGPMPQTRYILDKALKRDLCPLLLFNKLDRIFDPLRIDDSLMEIMELLDNIGYNEKQIDKIMSSDNIIYTSAKSGWSTIDPNKIPTEKDEMNMNLIFDAIINKINPPIIDNDTKSFKMLTSLIDKDDYWGRYLIGRVHSGSLKVGDTIHSINPNHINGDINGKSNNINVSRLFTKRGTKRMEVDSVSAGDIIGIPCEHSTVFDTLCSLDVSEALPFQDIDKPTISIRILANTSPLRGQSGDKILISDIGKRLENEAKINVCISVNKLQENIYIINGRGELQLAVLLENMRREGYEFSIAAPKVIYTECNKTGEKLEPFENVIVDVHPDHKDNVINYLDDHGGILQTFDEFSKDITRITYNCPTRGLLGYESKLRSDTRGTGRLFRTFESYKPINNNVHNENIVPIIAMNNGKATNYALLKLEPRAKTMYIEPGDDVYEGMIVGETNASVDLECDPCKQKQLTNIRNNHKEETVVLKSASRLQLEQVLTRIQSDELCEVTPTAIRLRKVHLSSSERKQLKRKGLTADL